MCGIVGVISSSTVERPVVERMRDVLEHRGPDHAGLWRSPDERVCFGHRRLSIIDLEGRSNQPMQSADGRYVITYNGEIYNYETLRRQLVDAGVVFRTESDTEVLIEAVRHWGVEALDKFSGMYAFALWDRRDRRLLCARDRAGEKPFYYAHIGQTFLFASEPKALLEWPQLGRGVDYEAVIDILTFGYVADPKSIWSEIRKLPPAHHMTVDLPDGGRPHVRPVRRYWSLDFEPDKGEPSSEEIRETLLKAADEMAISDVPLGVFLSGGVDSSSVTAALSLSGHDVESFTIGFNNPAYDERGWALDVAERYGTRHVARIVQASDVESFVDQAPWYYDEPFSDYSLFPTYHLCREARRSITVALSGDGADEVFAGYRKYQRLARRAELSRLFPVGVARALGMIVQHTRPDGDHWRRTLRQYGLEAAHMLADMLCIGFPLPLLRKVARGPLKQALQHYDPHSVVEDILVAAPPSRVGLLNSMRHLDFTLTLPGDMLVKVDRASMAVSLEVRPVFLHRDVMELAARIPPSGLANSNGAKLALREAVRPWLPKSLIDRRKQGFAMPLPEWLGGDSKLGGKMHDTETGMMSELLDPKKVANLFESNARGMGSLTGIVFAHFVLDQWFKRWKPT